MFAFIFYHLKVELIALNLIKNLTWTYIFKHVYDC